MVMVFNGHFGELAEGGVEKDWYILLNFPVAVLVVT